LLRLDPTRRTEQTREVGARVVSVPGLHAHGIAVDDRLDPVTVPLDFEQPVRVIEWRGRERGGHGFDELGQLRAGGLRQVDLGLCGRGATPPQPRPLALDPVLGPPGLDGLWEVLGVPAADRGFVALVDEEPGLAVLSFPRPGANDREAALQLLPVEPELQLAFLDR